MKITVNYNVEAFDRDAFMQRMELVASYAEKNSEKLYATMSDTACMISPVDLLSDEPETETEHCDHCEHHEDRPNAEVESSHDESSAGVSAGVDDDKRGVCKNCDSKFIKPRKNSEFCSTACRKEYFNHGKKSRKEREVEKESQTKDKCPICYEEFVRKYPKQKCCSPEHQKLYTAWLIYNRNHPITIEEYLEKRDAKLAEKKRRAELTQRQCANPQCGKMFQPSNEDQKYCSHVCKDAAHEQRKAERAGVTPEAETGLYKHICEVCEMPFEDNSPTQRFCEKCVSQFGYQECIGLAEDTKVRKTFESTRKIRPGDHLYKVCPKCGHNFDTTDPDQFYCDKCTAKALHQKKVKPLEPLKPEPIPPQTFD